VLLEIPEAGLRLPVPTGWETVDATTLADDAARAEIAGRYPGAQALIDAGAAMGDYAVPVFAAFDPAAAGTDDTTASNLVVLVAQPSVSGPLLEFVAGLIGGGFEDAFEANEVAHAIVRTPLGEAVRPAGVSRDGPARRGLAHRRAEGHTDGVRDGHDGGDRRAGS
jgi:hypothetical protein